MENNKMPSKTYPTFVERYFKKYYNRREGQPSEDTCVLAHSNRICLLTLTPKHKALSEGPIKSFRYLIETENKKVSDLHGKKKLGAIKMSPGRRLCEIVSGNGSIYIIRCAIKGKLCELNDELLKDITLLQNMPETKGFLAIGLHQYNHDDVCDYLLTEEQYLNGEMLLSSRVERGSGDEDGDKKKKETKEVLERNMPCLKKASDVEGDRLLDNITEETAVIKECIKLIDDDDIKSENGNNNKKEENKTSEKMEQKHSSIENTSVLEGSSNDGIMKVEGNIPKESAVIKESMGIIDNDNMKNISCKSEVGNDSKSHEIVNKECNEKSLYQTRKRKKTLMTNTDDTDDNNQSKICRK